ncbi:MAG: HAMP domain-containing protein [Anaerolineae bacterium]|nr:HAMP domain-containing protein [Anaerolineae bacterium]
MIETQPTQYRGRIRFALIITFMALTIIPPAFLVPFVLGQMATQVQEQVTNQLESVAGLKTAQIEAYLANGQQVLKLMVSEEELYQTFTDILQADTPQGASELIVYLNDKLAIQDIFRELFVYNTEGIISASTNEAQLSKRVVNLPYYEPSLTEEYIQSPYYEISSQDLNMVFTVPIISQDDGEVIGVLAGRADLGVLSQIMLDRNGLGETGETYLVSLQNSYLLTASRFEGYPINRSYRTEAINAVLSGQNGSGVFPNYRSEAVIGVYRWLPEIQSGLLAEIDEAEALANVRNLSQINLIVGSSIVLIAVGLGIFYANRLTRPIIELANTAKGLAQGDYAQRVDVNRIPKNELGALGESFNQMADAVQQRKKELEDVNESLKKARDEALAAQRIANENSRLKSEFLSTMSHELRTPMNAIEGFTGIMLKRMAGVEYNEKAERYLQKVQSNSRRLLALINDFLDLSRIESGRLELANLPYSPKEMAQKWRENLVVLADQKGLQFDVKVDENLPDSIHGDEESISKIAINLIGNAIKFTETGAVTVNVEKQDGNMAIVVQETGIGIPPHAREFIFDEFRQVDQSSKRVHGGTGLGLAIVQKLTREMGGTVTLQSEVGMGSTFTVILPLQTKPNLS